MTKSDAFIESKSLRESVIRHTEVLDKVKGLVMLPDGLHITIKLAAGYFEVSPKTIESLIHDNRDEIESDGLKVLKGEELKKYASLFGKEASMSSKTSQFTIIPRRAILRMGMLLRDSEVAKQIRTYLLNLEEDTPKRERAKAVSKIPVSSLNNAVKIVAPFMDKLGLSPEVQALTVRTIYKAGGIDLPFSIKSDSKFKDTIQIARELGMYSKSGKPAFTAVSQLIKTQIEVLECESETFMESRDGWQGSVEKYAPAVVEKVKKWLVEHGYPTQIKGQKKNYFVSYKSVVDV
jgi:hypothetical protein